MFVKMTQAIGMVQKYCVVITTFWLLLGIQFLHVLTSLLGKGERVEKGEKRRDGEDGDKG